MAALCTASVFDEQLSKIWRERGGVDLGGMDMGRGDGGGDGGRARFGEPCVDRQSGGSTCIGSFG